MQSHAETLQESIQTCSLGNGKAAEDKAVRIYCWVFWVSQSVEVDSITYELRIISGRFLAQ